MTTNETDNSDLTKIELVNVLTVQLERMRSITNRMEDLGFKSEVEYLGLVQPDGNYDRAHMAFGLSVVIDPRDGDGRCLEDTIFSHHFVGGIYARLHDYYDQALADSEAFLEKAKQEARAEALDILGDDAGDGS